MAKNLITLVAISVMQAKHQSIYIYHSEFYYSIFATAVNWPGYQLGEAALVCKGSYTIKNKGK